MRAAIVTRPGELSIGTFPTPRPGADEVLVKVHAAGICAGDLFIFQGKNPYATYPQVCGHEMSGTVVELGSGNLGFSLGDAVAVEPFVGCRACYACRAGKPNCCPRLQILGVTRPGGYAEYVVAPVTNLHRIPAGMSLETAALAEPVAIAVQACRRGRVAHSDLVLVMGCGPIGLAIVEVALGRGATVLAADFLQPRLEAAERLGAEPFHAGPDLLDRLMVWTGGEGVPVVIEATGSPQAIELSLAAVAAGGRIVVVGLVKGGLGVTFPGLDLTRKEPTILGSRASVDCFPESLALLAGGKLKFCELATQFSLWDAPAIFADLSQDASTLQKAVLIA